jgi:hypothetical protein
METTVTKRTIQEELEEIQKETGGLRPPDVVEHARNPHTTLHGRFQWDDGAAAEQYRLWQARHILRVYVTMEIPDRKDPVQIRAYVSLPADRGENGAGYRTLTSVMASEELNRQLLEMARRDARIFRNKYNMLSELSKVNKEIGVFLGEQS